MSSDVRSRCSSWVARLAHVSCRIGVRSPRVDGPCCLGPAGFRTHLNDDRETRPQRELLSTYRHPPGGITDVPGGPGIQPWQRTCVQGSIRDGEGLERAHHCEHAGMRAAAPRDFISMRRSQSLIRRLGLHSPVGLSSTQANPTGISAIPRGSSPGWVGWKAHKSSLMGNVRLFSRGRVMW